MIPIKQIPSPVMYPAKNLTGKYCISPFASVEITLDGHVRLCGCSGWMPTVVGNLFDQKLEDILASKLACDIRQSIIDGTYNYCNELSCGIITNNGLNSYDTLPPNIKSLISNSSNFDMPYEISLAGDIVCNLSCPSCRKKVISANPEQKEQQVWLAKQLKENLFSKPSDAAICLNLSNSGEVFASNMLIEFLKSIPINDFPNLTIKLQTNGLLLPKHWHKLGPIVNRVKQISVSVDAAHATTYELVRRGGTWEKLLDALKFIQQLKLNNSIVFNTRMVVQKENYKEILEFYTFSRSFSVDRVEYIRLGNWWWDSTTFKQNDVMDPTHNEYNNAKLLVEQLKTLPNVWLSGGSML